MHTKLALTTAWQAVARTGQRVTNHAGAPVGLTYDGTKTDPQFTLERGESHVVLGSQPLYAKACSRLHVQYVSVQDNVDMSGVALTKLVDQVSATVTYICEALPGTAVNSPAWRMQRLTVVGNVTTVEWHANGQFVGQASLRASVGYA